MSKAEKTCIEPIYKHYVIDMSGNNNFVQIPSVQGDGNQVRGFEVELIANGIPYPVDREKVLVTIAGTKPDTKHILNPCTVTEEGYILVDITYQMSAAAGRGDYQIALMDVETNSMLKSFPFHIVTTKSPMEASEVASSDEYQFLVDTVSKSQADYEDIMDSPQNCAAAKAHGSDIKAAESTANADIESDIDGIILNENVNFHNYITISDSDNSNRLNIICSDSGITKIESISDGYLSEVDMTCGDIYLDAESEIFIRSQQGAEKYTAFLFGSNYFYANKDSFADCGGSSHKWRNIYSTDGTIQTSDRTKKTDIKGLTDDKTTEFIMGLTPVSYKMADGTSGRTHYGLIAQDVEELMTELGMDSKDFAGFIKSPKVITKDTDECGNPLKKPVEKTIEGEYDYSLRYDEFIAPLIKTVQNLRKEVEELKNKFSSNQIIHP